MTKDQIQFLDELLDTQREETAVKFEAGVKEYGTKIWEIPVLELVVEAKREMTDGYVYLHTIEKTLRWLLNDPVIANRIKELTGK